MNDKYTEDETEDYLLSETRMLAMPDGSLRYVTRFRLFWRHFDYVVKTSNTLTPLKLAGLALSNSKSTGHEFDRCLEGLVSYASRLCQDMETELTALENEYRARK